MYIVEFLIVLIIISLLVALPFIFKSKFKTRNYMGYSMGVCCSIIAAVIISLIFIIGIGFWHLFIREPDDHKKESNTFSLGVEIFVRIFVVLGNIAIFLIIFFYTKRISNPNQPYNCVFMFIAGYLHPIFILIYLYFIFISFMVRFAYIPGIVNEHASETLIANELFCLFYMIQFAGTIILSMLHHRKVNKSILYILLVCYFSPIPFFLISFFTTNQYFLIPNMVIFLITFGFGVFFYCKYANHEYSNSEILEPMDI